MHRTYSSKTYTRTHNRSCILHVHSPLSISLSPLSNLIIVTTLSTRTYSWQFLIISFIFKIGKCKSNRPWRCGNLFCFQGYILWTPECWYWEEWILLSMVSESCEIKMNFFWICAALSEWLRCEDRSQWLDSHTKQAHSGLQCWRPLAGVNQLFHRLPSTWA